VPTMQGISANAIFVDYLADGTRCHAAAVSWLVRLLDQFAGFCN
jgi:hypothetical protein